MLDQEPADDNPFADSLPTGDLTTRLAEWLPVFRPVLDELYAAQGRASIRDRLYVELLASSPHLRDCVYDRAAPWFLDLSAAPIARAECEAASARAILRARGLCRAAAELSRIAADEFAAQLSREAVSPKESMS